MIMNNNLFKTLFIPAVACLLGACTESTGPDMETSGNSGAIRFAGPAVTRAAIDDADGMLTDGNSFSVWGNYTDGTGGTATSVFNAEKVTYVSGMWVTRARDTGSPVIPTTSTPFIRLWKRWAMPCPPPPARTAHLPSRASTPRKDTT